MYSNAGMRLTYRHGTITSNRGLLAGVVEEPSLSCMYLASGSGSGTAGSSMGG